jgi:hypothetical protein
VAYEYHVDGVVIEQLRANGSAMFRKETMFVSFLYNLDAQRWPDRERIDIPKYLKTWRDHHGKSGNLMTRLNVFKILPAARAAGMVCPPT